jgi:molybdopterin/thiamine biosynthesis adenylyltransferase
MLTKEQIKRYARQIILPEIGGKGQEKLLDAKVLVVGAGGLGSPVTEYLAAAGIGKIGIVDYDVVDISNLQRQTIHAGNLGKNKAESAKEFVERLNPDVDVDAYPFRITAENVRRLVRKYDVIVDCTDNFPTRFMLNDACVLEIKPLVHAAVLRFEGQLMTIKPHESACYRCVFVEAPPPHTVPSCQEAGVIGITTGLLGTLQASEALKLILGKVNILTNKLLYVDLLNMDFDLLELEKNPSCPVCGEQRLIRDIVGENYAEACRIG